MLYSLEGSPVLPCHFDDATAVGLSQLVSHRFSMLGLSSIFCEL